MKHLAILVSFICIHCSSLSVQSDKTVPTPLGSSSVAPVNSSRRSNVAGDGRRYDLIAQRSKEYDIDYLETKRLEQEDFEMRIWSSIELGHEVCFTVSNLGGRWSARLLKPILKEGELEKDRSGKIITTTRNLSEPVSGWSAFETYLNEKHLRPPLSYSLDSAHGPVILDEGVIALEAKEYLQYDVVSFRAFTKSVDGKAIVEVCKDMESRFKVSIGCEH